MRVKIYAPRQVPFSAIHFFWVFKHWIDSFPLIVFEPLIKTTMPAGVGTLEHLAQGVLTGGADAVLAASIFHFGEYTIREAKTHMSERGIEVNL